MTTLQTIRRVHDLLPVAGEILVGDKDDGDDDDVDDVTNHQTCSRLIACCHERSW